VVELLLSFLQAENMAITNRMVADKTRIFVFMFVRLKLLRA